MKQTIFKLIGSFILLTSFSIYGYSQNNVSTLKFDGIDDYVRYGDDATLGKMDGATNYTMECWIRPYSAKVAEYDRILQRYYSFAFVMYDGNNDGVVEDWYFYVYDNSSSSWKYYNTDGDATLTLDSWNHLAVINNETDNTLNLYVNGIQVTQSGGYSAISLRPSQSSDNLYIGAKKASTPNNSFGGKIDEVRLKNVAINPVDLHSDLNSEEYNSDVNTAVLFHFNENSGSVTKNEASGVDANLGSSASGDAAEPQWGTIVNLWFPIELKSFTATKLKNEVSLNWTTLSETNNKGFEIQHSTNTKVWEELGFVAGQGDSRGEINYEFIDKTPENSNFYRLKQIDFDGRNSYSDIVSVNLNNENKIRIYPNPTNDFVYIAGLNSNTDYFIFDKLGKVVNRGLTNGEIDVSTINSGVYLLKFNSNSKVFKLVVE